MDKYDILREIEMYGHCIISASQIKEFREPRLMTKFDHSVNLPEVFVDNNLSILPISRGDYVISSFDAYKEFDEFVGDTELISIPPHIQSLMPQFLLSEAIALNCASACGILDDFLEDDGLVPTVSGRMSSGLFDFLIDTNSGEKRVHVDHSQIEIDAAYEGVQFLSLFEAKRDLADDFLVRQLYYPFRVWNSRVTKEVKSIFLTYSNGNFTLCEYQFDNPEKYNSIYLVKQKRYMITTEISLADIETLLESAQQVDEPEISFPQADSMPRIINMLELLNERPMAKEDITCEYAFDTRQTNYYTDAGRYLGLVEKERDNGGRIVFRLSSLGQRIMRLEYRERQLATVSQIVAHRPFRDTLRLHLQYGQMPSRQEVVRLMRDAEIYHVKADITYFRRASTVTSWVNWILGIVDE